jgi:glycosyltransferase involved in cell wall biosynthesis
MLDVCICTHNPDLQLLTIVLQALANQTLSKDRYQVWIIDNASNPPIQIADLAILSEVGVRFELLSAPKLGVIYARQAAISATSGEWLVFVDDDNELTANYLEIALDLAKNNPKLGCFGGKLVLPKDTHYPKWTEALLPYLAIRDVGDRSLSKCVNYWDEHEPPGAGSIIRREVLELFQHRLAALSANFVLGRQGKSLLSAEDSMIIRGAYELGLDCAYQPQLQLIHHIKPQRFTFRYLVRLLYGYGRSYVLLERILGNSVESIKGRGIVEFVIRRITVRIKDARSFPHALCLIAWDCGYLYESRQQQELQI